MTKSGNENVRTFYAKPDVSRMLKNEKLGTRSDFINECIRVAGKQVHFAMSESEFKELQPVDVPNLLSEPFFD